MHEICYNRVSGHFGGSGSPSCCQKFRQHFMSEISVTTSKIRFFWRKKCKNWHFRLFILGGKGVRLVRNFFLRWSTLVRSKTPWQTKKTSGTSPAHWESILTSQDRKMGFYPIFNENFSFLEYFCRSAGRPPDTKNFFQQQVKQNIPIWGAHSKIGNIWPAKSSIPKPSSTSHFQTLKL